MPSKTSTSVVFDATLKVILSFGTFLLKLEVASFPSQLNKEKILEGNGFSFPEGEGCQFFLAGGVPHLNLKKNLPAARDPFSSSYILTLFTCTISLQISDFRIRNQCFLEVIVLVLEYVTWSTPAVVVVTVECRHLRWMLMTRVHCTWGWPRK